MRCSHHETLFATLIRVAAFEDHVSDGIEHMRGRILKYGKAQGSRNRWRPARQSRHTVKRRESTTKPLPNHYQTTIVGFARPACFFEPAISGRLPAPAAPDHSLTRPPDGSE